MLRKMVPMALRALKATSVATYANGVVNKLAAKYAAENGIPLTYWSQRDSIGAPDRPLDVTAWQMASRIDLAIGFFPSQKQRQLLDLLDARGVRCVCSGEPGMAFAPL